jgi:hypothetical protein
MYISYLAIYTKNYCHAKEVTSHRSTEHAQNTEEGDNPQIRRVAGKSTQSRVTDNGQSFSLPAEQGANNPLSAKAAYCEMLHSPGIKHILWTDHSHGIKHILWTDHSHGIKHILWTDHSHGIKHILWTDHSHGIEHILWTDHSHGKITAPITSEGKRFYRADILKPAARKRAQFLDLVALGEDSLVWYDNMYKCKKQMTYFNQNASYFTLICINILSI